MSTDPHEPDEEELEQRLRKLLGEAETADEDHLDDIELKLRDAAGKLDQLHGDRQEREGLFDAEFEDRLQSLHQRADKMKTAGEAKAAQQERNFSQERASARGLGIGLSVAYTIIGIPLVGVAVGWFVDKQLGTTMGKGIGVLIGMVIGMAAAMMILNRTNKEP